MGNEEEFGLSSSALIDIWEDLFNKKQKGWLSVLSGSMMPLLNIGDEVLVKGVKAFDVRLGDIIVFRNSDKLETHRVIRILGDGKLSFLQKGDRVTTAEIITSDQLVGKVVAVKKGSRIIQFDSIQGKVINFVLTVFSVSAYSLSQKNSPPSKFALSALNKMKKVFLYGLKKGVF